MHEVGDPRLHTLCQWVSLLPTLPEKGSEADPDAAYDGCRLIRWD